MLADSNKQISNILLSFFEEYLAERNILFSFIHFYHLLMFGLQQLIFSVSLNSDLASAFFGCCSLSHRSVGTGNNKIRIDRFRIFVDTDTKGQ